MAQFVEVRHVYERGEVCTLDVRAPQADTVAFTIDGWFPETVPVSEGRAAYRVDTAPLRAQPYTVHAHVTAGGERLAELRFALIVAAKHDNERMPVWRWGGGGSSMSWWIQRGFTGGFTGSFRDPLEEGKAVPGARTFEEATVQDFDLGLYLRPMDSETLKANEHALSLAPNGTRRDEVHPLATPVIEHAKRVAETCMTGFGQYPALRHVMLNSEWQTPVSVNPEVVELAKQETGLDFLEYVSEKNTFVSPGPDEAQNGLIADDNPRYRILQWWWQRGHGTAAVNEEMARIVDQYRSDAITWHEPYRLAPVRNSHRGLDCIGTWTYGHPDIKRLCYTTYLQAAARPGNQLVQQDITLFVYGRYAIPIGESTADLSGDFAGKDPYFTAGPDYAREAIWLVVSQRPDILAFYSAGRLSPDVPTQDPFYASPETFDAIGETCDKLVRPFGPAILACKRHPAPVAVLMSAAATWFPASPHLAGYPNEQTLPYATLLMMNHVPFDVLLDEDIAEGALDRYRVLVMPRADTLTRGVHAQIAAFAQKGGRVIADASLRAEVPGAAITNYDFTHQTRVDGNQLAKGEAVTAEEDRTIMEGYAAQLAALLTDVPRPAWTDSPRALTNTLQGGEVRYHFFINDDRTYGPRFGEWKLYFELGKTREASITAPIAGKPAFYKVLSREPIAYETSEDCARFRLRLPAARGELVAALPEAIGSVAVEGPGEGKLGAPIRIVARVLGESGKPIDGVLPIQVEVLDGLGRPTEWTRYTKTEHGERVFEIVPALNDAAGSWTVRVTDLVAGKRVDHSIAISVDDGMSANGQQG